LVKRILASQKVLHLFVISKSNSVQHDIVLVLVCNAKNYPVHILIRNGITMIMLLLNSEVYTPHKNARESESAKWIVRAAGIATCLDGHELSGRRKTRDSSPKGQPSLSEEAGSCLGETFRPAPAVGTVQLGKQRSRASKIPTYRLCTCRNGIYLAPPRSIDPNDGVPCQAWTVNPDQVCGLGTRDRGHSPRVTTFFYSSARLIRWQPNNRKLQPRK
jgi:hypothetical protein